MTDRPSILSAKLDRLMEIVADKEQIAATPKSERPGEASLDDVRDCGGKCVRSIREGNFASVAAVEQNTELPSERLSD